MSTIRFDAQNAPQTRVDAIVDHQPGVDASLGNLGEVLYDKLVVQDEPSLLQLWVSNSASGSVTRISLIDNDGAFAVQQGNDFDLLDFQATDLVPTRPAPANQWRSVREYVEGDLQNPAAYASLKDFILALSSFTDPCDGPPALGDACYVGDPKTSTGRIVVPRDGATSGVGPPTRTSRPARSVRSWGFH